MLLTFVGDVLNTGTFNNTVLASTYGVGSAPANGAALTGTVFGGTMTATPANNGQRLPFTQTAIVTGLTPSIPYWFDMAVEVNGNAGAVENVACTFMEF